MNWTARETAMMQRAVTLAHLSEEDNRHGCVVAKRWVILGSGWNKNKTHPAATRSYSKRIHAELCAIIGVNSSDLRGSDIFVARVMRSKGEPLGMSKPCPDCMMLIRKAGIRRIYFTNTSGKMEMVRI